MMWRFTPTALRIPAQGCRMSATLGTKLSASLQPHRGCGGDIAESPIKNLRNPFGVVRPSHPQPRVAAARQPWAEIRNAVGVKIKHRHHLRRFLLIVGVDFNAYLGVAS